MLRPSRQGHAQGPRRPIPTGTAPLLAVGSGLAGACVGLVAFVLGKGLVTAILLYLAVSPLLFIGALSLTLVAVRNRRPPPIPVECEVTGAARAAYLLNRRRRIRIVLVLFAGLAAVTLTENAALRQGIVLLSCALLLRRSWIGHKRRKQEVPPRPGDTPGRARPEAGKAAW